MKLPPDYQIASLGDLKRVVALIATGGEAYDEQLEMNKAQYLRYKELVFALDPIRFYQGMEIKITAKATQSATSSLAASSERERAMPEDSTESVGER